MNISNINLGKLFKKGDLGRHGRFAAVEGGGYTRPCKTEKKVGLLRVPKTIYFRTRYREMSISLAHPSEIET